MDWLDDKSRTQPRAVLHSRDGDRSKFRTQDPTRSRCLKCGSWPGPGINPFCNRAWSLHKTIWTVTLAISRAPALIDRDSGRSIFPHWSNAIAKRTHLCYGGSSHPTRSVPGRVQVGSRHLGTLHPVVATKKKKKKTGCTARRWWAGSTGAAPSRRRRSSRAPPGAARSSPCPSRRGSAATEPRTPARHAGCFRTCCRRPAGSAWWSRGCARCRPAAGWGVMHSLSAAHAAGPSLETWTSRFSLSCPRN